MKKLFAILIMFVAMSASAQWLGDYRLTYDTSPAALTWNNTKCIALNGPIIHIIWCDQRDGDFEIYYKRSLNSGVNWGRDIRLTNSTATSKTPAIATSDSVIHLVWFECTYPNWDLYYKRSFDSGDTWGEDTCLSINTLIDSWSPSIAVSGSVVHVLWQDNRDGNYEIYYKRSTDCGTNWSADRRLTNNTGDSQSPSVSVNGQYVHVVWYDHRDGNNEIYYKRSTDGGMNWGTDSRLTNYISTSSFPSIAVSGSDIHVVWEDYRHSYNSEIYYKHSSNGGASWEADRRMTYNNPRISWVPSVAAFGNVVHIVWCDGVYYDIFYKRSTDSGLIWETDTRLTNYPSGSLNPSIAVSGSSVNVVWLDFRDGNSEVYYKRNPTSNLIGIQNISTEIPSAYSLKQNYPNPFNPSTMIRYSVPKNGMVKLVVFDALGREVETLVNQSQQAGTYEASFDGSKLNSGVYFYKLITDGFTETKKMLLIK